MAEDPLLYPILLAVISRMGSVSVVHVEDLVEAQIFLMEAVAAEGRYMCSAGSCGIDTLAGLLSSEYPPFDGGSPAAAPSPLPAAISTRRLTELGFRFKYGIMDVVRETVTCCVRAGFLRNPEAVCSSPSQE